MKRRFWKIALLLAVPLALYAYIAEHASWWPTTLYVSANQVAFSHDSQRLGVLSSGDNGPEPNKVMCWSIAERRWLWDYGTNNKNLSSIDFLPDSHEIVSLHCCIGKEKQTEIRFHSGDNGQLLRTLRIPQWFPEVRYLSCSSDKITFSTNDDVYVMDLSNGRTNPLLGLKSDVFNDFNFRSVALAPDGKTLAGVEREEFHRANEPSKPYHMNLMDWPSGKVRCRLDLSGNPDPDPDDVSVPIFSPDSSLLAYSHWVPRGTHKVHLWDVSVAKPRHLVIDLQDQNYATTLAFSPDNQILAVGENAGRVSLWNTSSGALLRTLQHGKVQIRTAAFSPDGRTLASGSDGKDDGTVQLWRIK